MLPLLFTMAAPAAACGGFVCEPAQPVLQTAERVVFGVETDGTIEMHVQVAYEGPAEDFAWIVPTPEAPELFLTTSSLFSDLALPTQPAFQHQDRTEGRCRERAPELVEEFSLGCGGKDSAFSDGSSWADTGDGLDPYDEDVGVDVLRQEAVGPYDTVVLRAINVDVLTDWLADNGYDIPETLEPALEPYVASGSAFVALKLRKGQDAGDLAPLALRWQGEQGIIPIQLTSVAATPDMRLEVYVLGEHRAVPESYLHVQINEAAIDWRNAGVNYVDVVGRAADEAGGHAFATEFVGSPERWASTFDVSRFDRARLLGISDPVAWMEALLDMLPRLPVELDTVIEAHVPLPDDVTAAEWIQAPWIGVDDGPFDVLAATDDVELLVVEPLAEANALVNRHRTITRLSSTISPEEMTVDPSFVLNPDLPADETTVTRVAALVTDCEQGVFQEHAPRRLELPSGRVIPVPSERGLGDASLATFLQDEQGLDAAIVIEQGAPTGPPEVLTDHRARLDDLAVLAAVTFPARACGGCSAPAAAPGWSLIALGLGIFAGLRRRRRPPIVPARTVGTVLLTGALLGAAPLARAADVDATVERRSGRSQLALAHGLLLPAWGGLAAPIYTRQLFPENHAANGLTQSVVLVTGVVGGAIGGAVGTLAATRRWDPTLAQARAVVTGELVGVWTGMWLEKALTKHNFTGRGFHVGFLLGGAAGVGTAVALPEMTRADVALVRAGALWGAALGGIVAAVSGHSNGDEYWTAGVASSAGLGLALVAVPALNLGRGRVGSIHLGGVAGFALGGLATSAADLRYNAQWTWIGVSTALGLVVPTVLVVRRPQGRAIAARLPLPLPTVLPGCGRAHPPWGVGLSHRW